MFVNDKDSEILKDVLKPNLDILFCDLAVGKDSAKNKCYYAGSGNKFWTIISQIGLINTVITQDDYKKILEFNIGLTSLVKDRAGGEAIIEVKEKDREKLKEKILDYKPKILVFNGKKVAINYFQCKYITYGIYNEKIGNSIVYVLPSTSSTIDSGQDIVYWKELKSLFLKYHSGVLIDRALMTQEEIKKRFLNEKLQKLSK